ncbi:ribonuclease HI [Taibaiella soli]|uniref:ribonuclease H n=1 Tax=Taibaiella soli TaxID=1649169 RepID=A0A2W2AHM8_9BACT|nr:ribonuclease HI [Taibaiella soli]PZF71730.1 ribonuclease HI [Taibaiella soli]
MSDQLTIYTDGAARGNPGPGGYGVVLRWKNMSRELAQGYRRTTNNRMELMAVIAALQVLKRDGINIVVYSDSSYVVNAVEKGWLKNWQRIGFKGKKNADLWSMYVALSSRQHVRFVWVKGHADNPLNNRCDMLATAAADSGDWLVDEGYENAGSLEFDE